MGGMMPYTNEDLAEFWNRNEQRKKPYIKERSYMKGRNATIMQSPTKKYPDNKIAMPLAKIACDDLSGYAGRQGYTKFSWEYKDGREEDQASGDYNALMDKIYDWNDAEMLGAGEYSEALPHGLVYELHYTSDALGLPGSLLTPEFAMVPRTAMEIVYSDDIKPVKIEARHFVTLADKSQQITVYRPGYSEVYRRGQDSAWQFIGAEPNVYAHVPVAEFRINADAESLFESERRIIDAIDSITSKSVNEVDRFNAVISLFPDKVDKEFVDKLRDLQVIDSLKNIEPGAWPRYLQKDLSGVSEFYKHIVDFLKETYHASIKVPDMSNPAFNGNDASGKAMAYKLIGLEFRASEVDTYFNRGYIQRDELIQDVLKAGGIDTDPYVIRIKNQRNLPVDEEMRVRIAAMLMGIVSEETMLETLPSTIVQDAKREMQRKANESGGILDEPEITDDDQ